MYNTSRVVGVTPRGLESVRGVQHMTSVLRCPWDHWTVSLVSPMSLQSDTADRPHTVCQDTHECERDS